MRRFDASAILIQEQAWIQTFGQKCAGVTYQPPGCDVPLLNDVTMELQNHSLGVVYGRSGSGKTTLLQVCVLSRRPQYSNVPLMHVSTSDQLCY